MAEITGLTLGRMDYCEVVNHGRAKHFQGTGHIEASLVEDCIQLSFFVIGTNPAEENILAKVDLDKKALTAMIGQLETMKAVLLERLEEYDAS